MSDFSGKVIAVTGAGSGIGAATAELFAVRGGHVVGLDVDESALRAQRERLRGSGYSYDAIATDLRSSASTSLAFEQIARDFDRLDVLANVAGIVRYGRVEDISEDDWDAVLDTNLKSVFLTTRAAIPIMRASGGGAIVNVSSVQAIASQQLVAAYSASKGGIMSLTRSLALDHATDGIRVNCVLPGSVDTPMLQFGAQTFAPDDPDAAIGEWAAAHPLGFLARPHDVAEIILFLASSESRIMTGSCVVADEGLLARLSI